MSLRSIEIFCVSGIPFLLFSLKKGLKLMPPRSIEKNVLPRYHFSEKVRSHRYIFLYRPTMHFFCPKIASNPSKRDSKLQIFLHRYFLRAASVSLRLTLHSADTSLCQNLHACCTIRTSSSTILSILFPPTKSNPPIIS